MTRSATAFIPRNFTFWPDDAPLATTPEEIHRMYDKGYAGAYKTPEGTASFEQFITSQPFGNLNGSLVVSGNGLAGAGAGNLVLPFRFVEELLPGCWPGAAQQRGDCVSHSTKNAALTTLCCDIASGKPDEVSGLREMLPEISPEGVTQGALSTEAIYWYRGYNGDGWECDVAARVACESSALWPRRDYPDLGFDLSRYSGSLAGKYGSKRPPELVTTEGRKHLIRTATRINTADSVRDMLANGYGVTTCGGEGWSSFRDENGFSRRSGSWSHALAFIGFDDRDIIKQKYGEALVLVLNSWGRWNSGGRKILGTDILIPEGSFWALWSAVRNRSMIALSGANGWPAKSLPPFALIVG